MDCGGLAAHLCHGSATQCQWNAGLDLIHQLTWVALALLYGGAVLAVWSLVTYLRGVWVHFRWVQLYSWLP